MPWPLKVQFPASMPRAVSDIQFADELFAGHCLNLLVGNPLALIRSWPPCSSVLLQTLRQHGQLTHIDRPIRVCIDTRKVLLHQATRLFQRDLLILITIHLTQPLLHHPSACSAAVLSVIAFFLAGAVPYLGLITLDISAPHSCP